MSQKQLDPQAVRIAMLGMRGALDRHLDGRSRSDDDVVAVSTVEFLAWLCAVEDQLRVTSDRRGHGTDDAAQAAYVGRRDADPSGRVIPGLRHVRDRHIHQVIVSTRGDGVSWFGRFPSQLSAGIIWRPVDEITHPEREIQKRANYIPRREAYRMWVQNQPPWIALTKALRWIAEELQHRGLTDAARVAFVMLETPSQAWVAAECCQCSGVIAEGSDITVVPRGRGRGWAHPSCVQDEWSV